MSKNKKLRYEKYSERACADMRNYVKTLRDVGFL